MKEVVIVDGVRTPIGNFGGALRDVKAHKLGEVVVRECRKNPRIEYRPIGFLDDDPTKQGRAVLGLPVFGGVDQLPEVLQRANVRGCIISSPSILTNGEAEKIHALCREQGLWVKQLRLEFVEEGAK